MVKRLFHRFAWVGYGSLFLGAVLPEKSFQAYHDWRVRTTEVPFPESDLRQNFECNPDGSLGRFRTSQQIHEAIGAGAQKRDYSRIRVPVLARFPGAQQQAEISTEKCRTTRGH
jgi:hypothetical protein